MIHVAVEQCQKGDVLVVGCTADNTDGMFGELLATALRARGVIGSLSMPVPRRSADLGNEISGVVEGDLGQRHGQINARRSQCSGGLRGRECRTGRRRRCRRRWRRGDPKESSLSKRRKRRRSVRMTRMANASNSKRARSASTCTKCGSRLRRQVWCTLTVQRTIDGGHAQCRVNVRGRRKTF